MFGTICSIVRGNYIDALVHEYATYVTFDNLNREYCSGKCNRLCVCFSAQFIMHTIFSELVQYFLYLFDRFHPYMVTIYSVWKSKRIVQYQVMISATFPDLLLQVYQHVYTYISRYVYSIWFFHVSWASICTRNLLYKLDIAISNTGIIYTFVPRCKNYTLCSWDIQW